MLLSNMLINIVGRWLISNILKRSIICNIYINSTKHYIGKNNAIIKYVNNNNIINIYINSTKHYIGKNNAIIKYVNNIAEE